MQSHCLDLVMYSCCGWSNGTSIKLISYIESLLRISQYNKERRTELSIELFLVCLRRTITTRYAI